MKINKFENSYTLKTKVSFLELTFIIDMKGGDEQFVSIKNVVTGENLTHIFNKDGMHASFLIKDNEILDLINLCTKFTNYYTGNITVSADTTYENIENIYKFTENGLTNPSPIIKIKGDLIWFLYKDRENKYKRATKKII